MVRGSSSGELEEAPQLGKKEFAMGKEEALQKTEKAPNQGVRRTSLEW
jgi:hypothetical protein